jgi:hypothetical protein
METRCPSCSTPIPPAARYCPKCGQLANTAPYPPVIAPDAHPSTAPLPRAGQFVLIVGLIGLILLVGGLAARNLGLTCAGGAILGVLIVTMVAGDIFS